MLDLNSYPLANSSSYYVFIAGRLRLAYHAVLHHCLVAAITDGWVIGRVPRERALRDYLWFEEDEPLPGTPHVALRKAALLGQQLHANSYHGSRLPPWLAY